MRQIVSNAGEDAAVVLAKVREGKGTFGYNAATGEYGDMIDMGILDPTKVTRLALQCAAFETDSLQEIALRLPGALSNIASPILEWGSACLVHDQGCPH